MGGKIICPPGGGCEGGDNNRIKYLEVPQAEPERASWDDGHFCRHKAFEDDLKVIWPLMQYSVTLSGGPRADYKVWATEQVSIDTSVDESFHVCYCNSGCTNLANWFPVG